MKGYVARKGNRSDAVIYEGIDPITGKERRSWHPSWSESSGRRTSRARVASEHRGRNDEVRGCDAGCLLTSRWLPLRPSGYERLVGRPTRVVWSIQWP